MTHCFGKRIVAALFIAVIANAAPAFAQINLALGKTATASSTQYGVPNNVTDGVAVAPSRWGSVYAGDPAVADAQWIYVDLGSAQTIDKVTLRWETAYGKDYKIQTSNTADGTDWVDQATMTNQNGGQDDIPFAAVTARYVRMLGVDRGTGWGYSIWEFEIYNTGGSGGSAPVITSSLAATATVGAAFSYTIAATNNPTSFAATGLPAGLGVNTSTGVISGTPTTAAGSPFDVSISATNASGTDTKTLVLTVNPSGSAPVINSAATGSGTVGTAFSYQITATNSPTSYAATGLPGGLTLNTATGLISGAPATSTGSPFSVTLTATNGSGTSSPFTLTLTITADSTTNLALNQSAVASSFQGGNEVAKGNDGNATGSRWAAANGTYPQWWRVDLGSNQSVGRVDIAWYSSATRSYKYKIETSTDDSSYTTQIDKTTNTAFGDTSDSFGPVTARYVRITVTGASGGFASFYEIGVFSGGGSGGNPPVINSALTATAAVGSAFSYTITATNSPTSYGATGLPAGLSVNTTTGVISGTPTTSTGSPFTVSISATNASGTDTESLVLTVNPAGAAPMINSALTAAATVGTAFSYTITATNTPTSYNATGLPSWLTRSGAVLSGTPPDTTGSPFTIPITATNASGTDTKNLVLTVNSAPPVGNLAIGKTATASTPATGNIASKAIDGLMNTRWQATKQGTAYDDASWIQVDLGQNYNIGKIVLRWETAYGKDYNIQTSTDGSNWSNAAVLTNMPNTKDANNMIVHTIVIGGTTGVNTRFVRMQGVTRGTAYGYSLYEFEIYAFVPPPNQTTNQTIKLNFPLDGLAFGKVTVSPAPQSISPAPDLVNGSTANGSVIVVQNPPSAKTYDLVFPPNTDVTITEVAFSSTIPGATATLSTVDYKGDTITAAAITTRAFDNASWNFVVVPPPANPGNPPANWIPDPYLSAAPTPVPTAGSFGVTTPGNNAMLTATRRPTFGWAAASGATSYDLYVNISRTDYDWNAKGNLLDRFTKMNAAPITGTSYTLTTDLDDRWTYRWYVVANTGARSDMRTFSLYLPTLEQIDDGVSIVNGCRDMNKNGTIEPYEDWHNTPAVRAADLLGRMTTKQKAFQLFFNTQQFPEAGFGFGPFGPADAFTYQKAAAATALGIPYICLGDNIVGYKTVFPNQPALAATRDNQVAWKCADMQRREEVAVGYRGTLSPLSEVGTTVLYARIQEGCGEDADFAAAQLRALVTGLQGGPELNPKSLLITVKHWPSQGGGGESGVTYDGTTIWYHMRPWHGAFEANAACVMPGYSGSWLLNTQGHGAGDDAGILGFLRATPPAAGMAYQNLIMTDWLNVGDWVRAATAGSDIMGGANPGAAVDASQGGGIAIDQFAANVPAARIDDACLRVLTTKFKMGIFEDPYGRNVDGVSEWHTPENVAITREAASKCLTLLKNDGALPLRLPAGANIVVDGAFEYAVDPVTQQPYPTYLLGDTGGPMTCWTSFFTAEYGSKTVYEAIRDRGTAEGLNVYAPNAKVPVPIPNGTTINAAIIIVGEAHYTHGTYWTKETPYLPDDTTGGQVAHDSITGSSYGLIQQYRNAGIPVIVVCFLPRPYVLTNPVADSNAFMVVYRAGDEGGNAIADLIWGYIKPQGKLPWQLPRQMSQIGNAVQSQWQLQPDRWDLPYDLGVDTQGAADIKAVIAAGGSFPDLTTTGNPLFQHGFGIQGFGLTDATPPAAFTTLTPTNSQSITGAMPALSWQASSDAQTGIQKYQVYIDGFLVYETRKATSVTLSDIGVSIPSGGHTWYVKATNWADGSTNTPTASFSITDTTVPAAFAAMYPAAGSSVPAVNGSLTFYWEQSSDAGTGINSYIMKLDGVDQAAVAPSVPVSPAVNLALNKAASASATGYGIPRNANDGDGTGGSRWACPNNDQAAWWQVDLGAVYSIKQIVVNFQNNAASGYKLQVSVDGTNWTTLKTITGQTGSGVFTHNAANGLAAGAGRYVRFQGVTQSGAYGYSIYEFEVYGLGTESKTIPVSTGAHTWTVRAVDGANNTTNNSNGTLSFTRQ